MRLSNIMTAGVIALVVTGCAPRPEVVTIEPEPVYGKYGPIDSGSPCANGRRPTPGAAGRGQDPCLPPPPSCTNGFTDASGRFLCPQRGGDDPDDGGGSRPTPQ